MANASLNNVTTSDNYTNSRTLTTEGASGYHMQVANAAVYVQRATPAGGGVRSPANWGDEQFFLPGYYDPPPEPLEGIRVRSAVPGSPAQVSIHVY